MKDIVYLEDMSDVAETGMEMLSLFGFAAKYFECAQILYDKIDESGSIGNKYFLDHDNQTVTNPNRVSGGDIAMKILEIDPSAEVIIGTGRDLTELPKEVQYQVQTGNIKYLRKPFRFGELAKLLD